MPDAKKPTSSKTETDDEFEAKTRAALLEDQLISVSDLCDQICFQRNQALNDLAQANARIVRLEGLLQEGADA